MCRSLQYKLLRLSATLAFSIVSCTCAGQLVLRGMVADSSSMQPLPDVNLIIKNTGPGTSTDIRGGFELNANMNDSIVISRVGYVTRTLPAYEINRIVIIFLREDSRMLDTVRIEERLEPAWLPKLPPESSWKNNTTRSVDVPGFQGIQTFGPGFVFKGVFSRNSRENKEKRKLAQVKERNYQARDYVSLVNDPEVKGRILKDYGLTEDQFYALLAKFNQRNQNVIYRLEAPEVVALLLKFFDDEVGKR